jgi:hypothetical protein
MGGFIHLLNFFYVVYVGLRKGFFIGGWFLVRLVTLVVFCRFDAIWVLELWSWWGGCRMMGNSY